MEALRVLANAKFKPKNTLEFHFYGGEEGGLLGSAAVFANYKAAGKTVLAFVVSNPSLMSFDICIGHLVEMSFVGF